MKPASSSSDFAIRSAEYPADLETARELFREYAAWLGIDFCFQGFDAELAALPGYYAPPRGELLIAEDLATKHPVGCVAVRPMSAPGMCEMKRMYVRQIARGTGLGRRLAIQILEVARKRGYRVMRLDTLGRLVPAITLYRSLGFRDIPAYYDNPIPGVVYLELGL